jgi:hypothetical protein
LKVNDLLLIHILNGNNMMNQNTFAGLPPCKDIAGLSAGIAIVGIPHGISYSVSVPSYSVNAPMAIRKAAERYGEMIDHYDFDFDGPLLDNREFRVLIAVTCPVVLRTPSATIAGPKKRFAPLSTPGPYRSFSEEMTP